MRLRLLTGWTVKSGYAFTGFFQPVSNPPKINSIKAGSLIPVRFSLGGNFGANIFATGYPQSQPIACSTGASLQDADINEVETPGSMAGRFAVGGAGGTGWVLDYYNVFTRQWQYLFIWKTDRTWAGTCRQLIVQFNEGGARRTWRISSSCGEGCNHKRVFASATMLIG